MTIPVKVIYGSLNLNLLLQGKDITHKDGLFICHYKPGDTNAAVADAIEELKKQALEIGANAIIIPEPPYRDRSTGRWCVAANAVVITDSE